MIFKKISHNNDRSPQSIMLQLGSKRCYLLKEEGELITFDSCVCLNNSGREKIYCISNRGFYENTEKVIWPIKEEDVLADLAGVEAIIQGMISKSLNRENLNVYAVIQPQLTHVEIKAVKESIDSLDYVKSSSIIFKPIATAVGIGLDIDRILPPIYIVDMHCITRGHYTCSNRFQYGINLTTIIEGRIYESNWFYAWEDKVVEGVLARIDFPHPSLYIVGDCDDIYLYCKHFNETGACSAVVPDNPNCIALLGLKKMVADEQYKRYFTLEDENI